MECWGSDSSGQLGDGSLTSGVSTVSSGARHTCALMTAGGVKCWGLNAQGQLGDGSTADSTAPIDVTGLTSDVVAIDTGGLQSCAVTGGGGVKCWGGGYGTTPVDVPGFPDAVVAVNVGVDHVCALTAIAEAYCWGNNGVGQLGDGTTISRTTPATVVDLVAKPTATPTPCPAAGCPTATPPPVCPADACMDLVVLDDSGGEVCRSSGNTKCEIPVGGAFTAVVEIVAGPGNGYVLAQSWVDWGIFDPAASEDGAGPGTCNDGSNNDWVQDGVGDRYDPDCFTVSDLTYKPRQAIIDELVWPDCLDALAFETGGADLGFVAHTCITGLVPPPPKSAYVGRLVELDLNCSSQPTTNDLKLLAYLQEGTETSGALFSFSAGTQTIPRVGNLTVNCVEAAPAAVGGVALGGELRGIAGQDRNAPWLWATLGLGGAIVAMSVLTVLRRYAASR